MYRTNPYYLECLAGNVPGAEIVTKFGHNPAVGTSPTPISHGGVYRTPQVSGATQVRVKAGNVNDTADGTGAREIYIEGIDTNGLRVSEMLTTAGASASVNSVNSYIRMYRAYVNKSGTYGTQAAASHVADIVIENVAGTEDWGTIDLDTVGFADGQTEIGAYTVPINKTAYLLGVRFSVDTTKVSSLFFYKRGGILDTAAPYQAIRKQFGRSSAVNDGQFLFDAPILIGSGFDIGFLGFVAVGTAEISIEFDLLLRDNE